MVLHVLTKGRFYSAVFDTDKAPQDAVGDDSLFEMPVA